MDEAALSQIMEKFSLMQQQFVLIHQQFALINRRLDEHDQQFALINRRLDEHDQQFALINRRLDEQDQQYIVLTGRFDSLERQRSDDRNALMETLGTIDHRLDMLEQHVEQYNSRFNDISARHRHLVHKVADLEEAVAAGENAR